MNPPVTRRRPLAVRVWRNPLARGFDRAEALLTWSLLIGWLLALPVLAVIGSEQWTSLQARSAAYANSVVAVDAVLVTNAAYDLTVYRSAVVGVGAEATWVGRDGLTATGRVSVTPDARAGDHVSVWLDPAGTVVPGPMSATDVAFEAVLVAVGGWLGLGLLSLGVWWLARWRLDRRRWQAWEQEWERAEPGHNSSAS